MTHHPGDLLLATVFLAVGVVLLVYIDKWVEFDQRSAVKMKALVNRKLGNSMSRELWPAGSSTAYRISKIAFRFAGVFLLIVGVGLLFLTFRTYLP